MAGALVVAAPAFAPIEGLRQGLRDVGRPRAAKALGLTIAPSLLARADELIR